MKKQWILVAATLIGSPLLAQQQGILPDSSGIRSLDEVVVTANKTPQKQSSTGKVLTVIDRRTLENNSGRTISQVLNEQAGIIVNGAQNALGTNQTIYMRGAAAANTLILIDGMPVTDGSGITIQFDINHIATDQVERIEILKGAQSTLYGSDAVAGVINIITRKNQSGKALGANLHLAGGTYGTFKGNAGVSGQSGKFNYSLQYDRLQSKGFSAAYDATGNQGFDKDGYHQDIYNASLGYSISNHWSLRGYWQKSRYGADIDDDALADDKNNTIKYEQDLYSLQSLNTFKNGSVTVNLNYNGIRRRYDDLVNNPVGQNDYDPFHGDYKGRSLFAESYLNLVLHKHLALLAGIDYRSNSADITTSYSNLGKDSLAANMMSAYTSFSLKEFGWFGAEIGGRLTHHNDFGDVFTYSVNPYFMLQKNIKLYGSVATAFRAPSVYHLASEYGNPDLDPEHSFQYEAGLQYNSNSKKITARATYFNRSIKDVIIFQSSFTPPYGQYKNADKQADKGVETEFIFRPSGKLQFTANYTFTDGAITTQNNGKDSSYFNLYRRPKHNVNLQSGFQLNPRLYVSASFRWVDKRQDIYFNPASFEAEPKQLGAYYNLGAYANYKAASFLEIYADFSNITNQQYFDLYGYNSRRFNMMAGVKVKL
ncbi:TonB-dependent receptor plug domain-containing protein [Flavihumibacter profundi]|uniref:TonB-dependent receptor plug domain-containing protein n=1 Tax=Flavihumibacter profundi TaxID=2716883 RepID=UPI001CC4B94A|nr:TonB-dependent receptor [Flavihumibacter profundi]MBZ5858043.1 TonB-dependent receptor [Flavihumibacter profundi]